MRALDERVDKQELEALLATLPPRSFQSALFNMAHAYAQAADVIYSKGASTGNRDFAGPAIMCQAFAVELLLKFFLATDHPNATGVEDLKAAGVKLNVHKYSQLFDQLSARAQNDLATSFADQTGQKHDPLTFRAALVAQGDDPFVYWRYIYETKAVSHFDRLAFNAVTDALGKAAEAVRKLSPK